MGLEYSLLNKVVKFSILDFIPEDNENNFQVINTTYKLIKVNHIFGIVLGSSLGFYYFNFNENGKKFRDYLENRCWWIPPFILETITGKFWPISIPIMLFNITTKI